MPKQSPDFKAAQKSMQPGRLTRDGMMGEDTRNIEEIIDADTALVLRHDLTHEQIAHRMQQITDAARERLGTTVTVDGFLEATLDEAMGRISCPFGHRGRYLKAITTVRNRRTGEEVRWTELSMHLIGTHGFYEGRGAPFRVDPEALIRTILPATPL